MWQSVEMMEQAVIIVGQHAARGLRGSHHPLQANLPTARATILEAFDRMLHIQYAFHDSSALVCPGLACRCQDFFHSVPGLGKLTNDFIRCAEL